VIELVSIVEEPIKHVEKASVPQEQDWAPDVKAQELIAELIHEEETKAKEEVSKQIATEEVPEMVPSIPEIVLIDYLHQNELIYDSIDPDFEIMQSIEAERLIDHEGIQIDKELLVPAVDDEVVPPIEVDNRVETLKEELDIEKATTIIWDTEQKATLEQIKKDLIKARSELLQHDNNSYRDLAYPNAPDDITYSVLTVRI
jgi:hypothetical protein